MTPASHLLAPAQGHPLSPGEYRVPAVFRQERNAHRRLRSTTGLGDVSCKSWEMEKSKPLPHRGGTPVATGSKLFPPAWREGGFNASEVKGENISG